MRRIMKTNFIRKSAACAALFVALFAWTTVTVTAQSGFETVAKVDDKVVTAYEISQRARFLNLFSATADAESEALDRLIDERLQVAAADRLGLSVTEDGINAGMEEFAARANLNREQFIAALAQAGIAEPTFRDFIVAGLLWREVVRTRFAPRVQISEAEIALSGSQAGVRVLLSEIILPARNAQEKAAAERRAATISRATSFSAFASSARQFSASPSRARGGRLEWLPIGNLPPAVRTQVLTLAPGQVTSPIAIPNALALFQLRELEEIETATPDALAIDYAEFLIPGGSETEAKRVKDRVDTCDDLYGVAKSLPEDRLLREVRSVAEIPGDVALALAQLDEGEVSTDLVRGTTRVVLMLCGRTVETDTEVDRAAITSQLRNQRLASYANGYLAELKADAEIIRPE
jgi:peptidyl-prolyl cis-trans isomerase SurA